MESRVPAAIARRMAFVMGMSRRIARSGPAGAGAGAWAAIVASGRAAQGSAAHASTTRAVRPDARKNPESLTMVGRFLGMG